MPTYQYACTACDERLEAVQSFTDAPLTQCPACAGTLRKVFSAVGVVFKGSGFYKNDSRSAAKGGDSNGKSDKGEKAPAASASSDAGSGSSTSSGGSADAGSSSTGKPAAATKTPASAAPASKSA